MTAAHETPDEYAPFGKSLSVVWRSVTTSFIDLFDYSKVRNISSFEHTLQLA
jgi:hypothetical protein